MANSLFIKADEVAELLGVSRAEAYRIIKRLNNQLSSRGFIVVNGRVNGDRIFPITKSYLHHEMKRGCEASGVKKIRIHDLRHAHVSLLIDMGFSAVAIANRVGHESIDIPYRYAHLFPTRQNDMADKLNMMF